MNNNKHVCLDEMMAPDVGAVLFLVVLSLPILSLSLSLSLIYPDVGVLTRCKLFVFVSFFFIFLLST